MQSQQMSAELLNAIAELPWHVDRFELIEALINSRLLLVAEDVVHSNDLIEIGCSCAHIVDTTRLDPPGKWNYATGHHDTCQPVYKIRNE